MLPSAPAALDRPASWSGPATAVAVAAVAVAAGAGPVPTVAGAGLVVALVALVLGPVVVTAQRRRGARRHEAALADVEATVESWRAAAQVALAREFPTSRELADRLHDEMSLPRMPGAPAGGAGRLPWLVLGKGAVESGIRVVADHDGGVAGEADGPGGLVRRAEVLDAGPLCVDPRGGVVVEGPDVLVRGVVDGYRLQLRASGLDDRLVRRGDDPGTRPAACVVQVRRDGAAEVRRRDHVACRVAVEVSAVSVHEAPARASGSTLPGRAA